MINSTKPKYSTMYAQGAADIRVLCANVNISYETGSDSEIILEAVDIINVDREVLLVHFMEDDIEFEIMTTKQFDLNYESAII